MQYSSGALANVARGNVFDVSIPGIVDPIRVMFPDRRLPVCQKCKGHYKTREHCRVRKNHIELPWCSVYICITLDSSCIDHENKLKNGPFQARNTESRPYNLNASANLSNLPMCLGCKDKNYTGSSCRNGTNAHRSLPWTTVYVELYFPGNAHFKMNEYKENTILTGVVNEIDRQEMRGIEHKLILQKEQAKATECDKRIKECKDLKLGSKKRSQEFKEILSTKKRKSEVNSSENEENEEESIDVSYMDMNTREIISREFLIEVSNESFSLQCVELDGERAQYYRYQNDAQFRIQQATEKSYGTEPEVAYGEYNYYEHTQCMPPIHPSFYHYPMYLQQYPSEPQISGQSGFVNHEFSTNHNVPYSNSRAYFFPSVTYENTESAKN